VLYNNANGKPFVNLLLASTYLDTAIVLSGHMEWNAVGEQINDFGNSPPRPHNPKILLAKLRPGQVRIYL
jgi:hypothetical protein